MKVRILDILKEKGKTKYWLWSQTDMSYGNFSKIVNNETKLISFKNIELFCDILDCTPSDLFDYKKKWLMPPIRGGFFISNGSY